VRANVVSGIRFGVQEPTQLLDEARTKAMIDARRKAEIYANAAGVKLGRPLSVQEVGAVPSAPEAAGGRAWEVMSRGRGRRVGCPPPEGVDVAYPPC
jgi:uncharacterized protein YggE